MLGRVKKRTVDALAVVACSHLKLPAKLSLLRILTRRAANSGQQEVGICVGDASLSLKPTYYPDFATFRDVFLREIYHTDYRGTQVLDLGAHKGYFARYALMRGAGHIHCFEPDATNFSFLRSALAGELGTHATLWNEAVAKNDGEETFHLYDQSWSHSLTERTDRELRGTRRVICRTLENAIDLADGKNARLIVKMDIEGAECETLLATDPAVLRRVDEWFVETHPFGARRPEEIVDHLRAAGFAVAGTADPDVFHFSLAGGAER